MAADFVQDDLFSGPQELPQGLHYEPGFLAPADQDAVIAQIETLPLREAKPVYGMVAGISLAGTGRMRFRPYDAQDAEHTHTLDLAPGSLYVMRDTIRWRWQHSLLPVKALRYSITLRTRATAAEQARW